MPIAAFGWYGAIIGTGMAICILLGYFMAKRRGYDADIIFTIAIVCIPLAILGARTYYVVNDIIHNGNSWSFLEFIGFEDGKFVGFAGLAIYGGLLGGIIGALIVRLFNKRKPVEKQMTFIQMADLCFCLIILGQAIGRWGNFANQEAYGQLVTNPNLQWFPFAVYIDKKGAWYNACFFYESLWNFIGFGLLQWLYNGKRKSFDGFYFAFYCMWYGFIRFLVEWLRSDSMMFGPIKANQLISAVIFFLGAGIIIYHLVMSEKAHKRPFICVKEDELCGEYYGYEKSFFYIKDGMPEVPKVGHCHSPEKKRSAFDGSGVDVSSDFDDEMTGDAQSDFDDAPTSDVQSDFDDEVDDKKSDNSEINMNDAESGEEESK